MFDEKILLVTGGTGSFGNAVVRRFLKTGVKEIRVFSRDELKQDDMRREYANKKLKFYIGDVRDRSSIDDAMCGVDFVFHAAALKQVPSCEFYPKQAVDTNILGTENLLCSAIDAGVSKVIALSTDKACYPVNAMGISKAMMERLVVAKARNSQDTMIACTRYGNVLASRGSVIPTFVSQVLNKSPITITDPLMTRFIMSLDEAVDLVMFAFENGVSGDIFVQKAKAANIQTLADAIRHMVSAPSYPITLIGTRHGEKLYETLLTNEEASKAVDMGHYYKVPCDSRDLNYEKYFSEGGGSEGAFAEFNSHNAPQLNTQELIHVLESVPEVMQLLSGVKK